MCSCCDLIILINSSTHTLEIHRSSGWELDTILQEEGNCHLYEKLGYRATGATTIVNERMTLVLYRK